jgi:hypothetical protein
MANSVLLQNVPEKMTAQLLLSLLLLLLMQCLELKQSQGLDSQRMGWQQVFRNNQIECWVHDRTTTARDAVICDAGCARLARDRITGPQR